MLPQDLHWRARVERELTLLAQFDEDLKAKQELLSTDAGARMYEDALVLQAVEKHGGNWARIFSDDRFAPLRKYTVRDLAQRWKQLVDAQQQRCALALSLPSPPRRSCPQLCRGVA